MVEGARRKAAPSAGSIARRVSRSAARTRGAPTNRRAGFADSELRAVDSAPRTFTRHCGGCCGAVLLIGWLALPIVRNELFARDACALAELARGGRPAHAPPLPKIIHQQWRDESLPPQFARWRRRFEVLFPPPEYTHVLWTDASQRAFVATHFPWFLHQYDAYPRAIERADAARYFILYAHGGLYADLDYEPLHNFWTELPADRPALLESPYRANEVVQNALMSSPRAHLFWNRTFELLRARARRVDSGAPLDATGPRLLSDALAAASAESDSSAPALLACENFQRLPLGAAGWADSTWPTIVHRELHARGWRTKSCGLVWDARCHFGVHHNTVVYLGGVRGRTS